MSDYVKQRLAEIRSNPALVSYPPAEPPMRIIAEPSAPTRKGYIYFAVAGDKVKIGFTVNIASRVASLRTGNHEDVRVHEAFASYFEAERMVHQRFEADRIRGEWFRLTPEIEELWEDIWDYQGSHAPRDNLTGKEFIESLPNVFIDLKAVKRLLANV